MTKYRIPSDYENQTPRAVHNRASSAYGTIHPGLAIPAHHRHLNVGERIRGRIDELLQSQPMRGPLMNGFKLIAIATFTPDSAIYGWMCNGRRYTPDEWTKFGKVYFPLAGTNLGTYKDPAFGYNRPIRRLTFGLDLNADIAKIYESWVSDDLNGDDETAQPTHIGRGGLWDWLGIAPGAVCPNLGKKATSGTRGEIYPASFNFNAAPFFAYFLSHYYYIANMQEDYMYFTRGVGEMQRYRPDGQQESLYRPFFSDVFSSIDPNVVLDGISNIVFGTRAGKALNVFTLSETAIKAMACAGIQGYGGLLSVPYSPDLFSNIIKNGSSPTVEINVQNDETGDSDTGFSVAVPELRLKTKIQNWVDRVFASGGRVGDVFRTLWGVKSSAPYTNKPDFLGVWQASVNPSNVRALANGSASGEDANLGQLAACVDKYCDFSGHSGIDYYAKEPGTFMIIVMLVPEPAYFQGLHPDLASISFGDDFNPELNGIGFQQIPRHRFTIMPRGMDDITAAQENNPWLGYAGTGVTTDPNMLSVGEEVAFSWLRTDYPRLHGDFAQNGDSQYWVLARRFTSYFPDDGTGFYGDAEGYSTYVNPLDWQYVFVDQTLMSGNFAYYGYFDLKVTSSLSANYMPYLGR